MMIIGKIETTREKPALVPCSEYKRGEKAATNHLNNGISLKTKINQR
jgi:hypothetical protein